MGIFWWASRLTMLVKDKLPLGYSSYMQDSAVIRVIIYIRKKSEEKTTAKYAEVI